MIFFKIEMLLWLWLFLGLLASVHPALHMNKTGCGQTKACLFKPAGCDPNLDCTIGVLFYVIDANKLRIEMVATSLLPPVPQQYIAVAFSDDPIMGDDSVVECVVSDSSAIGGSNAEPEAFTSFNRGKFNDRVFLNEKEQETLYSNINSEAVDGHITCHLTRQILPQFDNKNGRIFDLNKEYYVLAATGSAQPDEINVHTLNHESYFYPIVSAIKINPSKTGQVTFQHPPSFQSQGKKSGQTHDSTAHKSASTIQMLTSLSLFGLLAASVAYVL